MIDKRIQQLLATTAVLGLASFSSGCMLMHARDGGRMGHPRDGHASAAACPVCGNKVAVDERTPRATHKGRLLYFASEAHLREFIEDPSRYRAPRQSAEPIGGSHSGHGGAP